MNLPENYLIDGLNEDNQQSYLKSGLKDEQASEIKHFLPWHWIAAIIQKHLSIALLRK